MKWHKDSCFLHYSLLLGLACAPGANCHLGSCLRENGAIYHFFTITTISMGNAEEDVNVGKPQVGKDVVTH